MSTQRFIVEPKLCGDYGEILDFLVAEGILSSGDYDLSLFRSNWKSMSDELKWIDAKLRRLEGHYSSVIQVLNSERRYLRKLLRLEGLISPIQVQSLKSICVDKPKKLEQKWKRLLYGLNIAHMDLIQIFESESDCEIQASLQVKPGFEVTPRVEIADITRSRPIRKAVHFGIEIDDVSGGDFFKLFTSFKPLPKIGEGRVDFYCRDEKKGYQCIHSQVLWMS